MDRRSFLAGAAATVLAAGDGWGAAAPSLRAAARLKGIDIGSAVGARTDVVFQNMLRAHCSIITPEWQLKPKFLKPRAQSAYNFGPADEIAAFAAANGQKLHGHSLFWHKQPIGWAEGGDFDMVRVHYGGYIRGVVARYPQIVSWDVFNEILGHEKALQDLAPIKRHGEAFIDFCFRTAHEAVPAAKLAINDHSLECAGDWCGTKQLNALTTLKALLKRGTPVHAVGIQCHLSSTWQPWGRRTAHFIDAVGDLGLEVYLSELDVNDSRLALDPARRDRQVASYYRDFLGQVLERKAVKRVMFWGMSDAGHWMVRGHGTGERRREGRPRPALFDEADQPKPAFDAVLQALLEAPAR